MKSPSVIIDAINGKRNRDQLLKELLYQGHLSVSQSVISDVLRDVLTQPAAFRNASILGTRLFGLSKLKDRTSPSCDRTNSSIRSTAC